MARQDHWWNEPPPWAWVTMVAGLVALIVMLPIALNRASPASDPSGEAPATTAAAETSSVPAETPRAAATSTADATRVLAIGDSDTGGLPQAGAGWPTLLEQRLPGTQVEVAATGDAGYVTTVGEPTLSDLVAGADLTDVDLVILFGSRFDAAGIADQVSVAAQAVLAAIREAAPEATLIVIGPAWPDATAPAGVRNNRDVIRAAAQALSVPFVDPLSEEWLTGAPGLLAADGVHLTDEGHVVLVDRIQPIVQEALQSLATAETTVGG